MKDIDLFNGKFCVFAIKIYYTVQKNDIFNVIEIELCKVSAIISFLFFSIGNGVFSLLLLCSNSFNLQSLRKIVWSGVRIEDDDSNNEYNTTYFVKVFTTLFNKINCKHKNLKCKIHVKKLDILKKLIYYYIHNKNQIHFDSKWSIFFTVSSLNMLETLLIERSSQKSDNSHVVNDYNSDVKYGSYYIRKKNNNKMCLREKLKVLVIILVCCSPLILFLILFLLKYIQIQRL